MLVRRWLVGKHFLTHISSLSHSFSLSLTLSPFLAMETPQPHYRKTPEPGSNCQRAPAVQQDPQMKWFGVLVECWWLELTKGSPCGSPEFCCSALLASDFFFSFFFLHVFIFDFVKDKWIKWIDNGTTHGCIWGLSQTTVNRFYLFEFNPNLYKYQCKLSFNAL